MAKIDNVISILGNTYFQPISDLLEKWLRRDKPIASGWQSGFYESGYATSVILKNKSSKPLYCANQNK